MFTRSNCGKIFIEILTVIKSSMKKVKNILIPLSTWSVVNFTLSYDIHFIFIRKRNLRLVGVLLKDL